MPGFLETTVYTGYGYLDPYVSPYVEKARNTVPLIDRAAKGAEEVVPKVITRVDEFTEPRIEKLRPIVEPRIEQVKEIATPYIDSSVKRYEVVKTEGCKYYSQTLEYKKSKVAQVQKMKEDKINWCKKVLCKKGQQVNQLFRVPATDNVEGLKFQGVMGKMAALLQKTEGLVDKWMPALPKGVQAAPPADYDDSYLLPRMFLLVVSVQNRLVHATKTKCDVTLKIGTAKFEKTKFDVKKQIAEFDKKAKAVMQPKVKQLMAVVEPKYLQVKSMVTPKVAQVKLMIAPKIGQVKSMVTPKVEQVKSMVTPKIVAVMKSTQYKKACEIACKGLTFSVKTSEKIIGKDKTKSLIQAVEMRIPASWKTAPPAPVKKTK